GVTEGVVWRWRRALGVGRTDSPGSRRLIEAASEQGAAKTRGQRLSRPQVELRRRNALRLRLGDFLEPGYHGRWWTEEEKDLLGTAPDAVIAKKVKRTTAAVRLMRTRCKIPSADDGRPRPRRRPRPGAGHPWRRGPRA